MAKPWTAAAQELLDLGGTLGDLRLRNPLQPWQKNDLNDL